MIRAARPEDAAPLDAFLRPHTPRCMFLRGNLARHGLFEREHPHGTSYFLWEPEGQIAGVFGCTNGGYLMCMFPDPPPDIWSAIAPHLDGATITGMTGNTDHVSRLLAALGLRASDFALNHIEPLYQLDIATLPDTAATRIRRTAPEDEALLLRWFQGYVHDTEPDRPSDQVDSHARAMAERAIHMADTRLLIEEGIPRAMTSVTTTVDDIVQVSGVYVPPQWRGEGRAGQVVAAHLDALHQSDGINQAILFAHNRHAARAYERIGFVQIDEVRIARLHQPRVVATAPQSQEDPA